MVGPRVFFYVQHLLGIGHLARASHIASALTTSGCSVVIVTGGVSVPGFPAAAVPSIVLPALATGGIDFRSLVDEHGNIAGADFLAARCAKLLDAFHSFAPDVVILEAFPFGRRQMCFELLPLIEAIASSSPRPKLFTSVRDILQPQSKPERDEETVALLRDYFDGVIVHGDPKFARLEETFRLADKIGPSIFYTGLVAPLLPSNSIDTFDVVVSGGGGASGRQLIQVSLAAARSGRPDLTWCIIVEPHLPDADLTKLKAEAPSNVYLGRFREDFLSLLSGCQLSISQAGYNTICDLLVTRSRSILVPYARGGETEQSERARRLQSMGRAVVLPEAELTSELLFSSVNKVLALPKPASSSLDLNGSERTSFIIWNAFAETTQPSQTIGSV